MMRLMHACAACLVADYSASRVSNGRRCSLCISQVASRQMPSTESQAASTVPAATPSI